MSKESSKFIPIQTPKKIQELRIIEEYEDSTKSTSAAPMLPTITAKAVQREKLLEAVESGSEMEPVGSVPGVGLKKMPFSFLNEESLKNPLFRGSVSPDTLKEKVVPDKVDHLAKTLTDTSSPSLSSNILPFNSLGVYGPWSPSGQSLTFTTAQRDGETPITSSDDEDSSSTPGTKERQGPAPILTIFTDDISLTPALDTPSTPSPQTPVSVVGQTQNEGEVGIFDFEL